MPTSHLTRVQPAPTTARPGPTLAPTPAPTPSIPAHARLHHFFEHTADTRPMAVALECDGQRLTYRDLDQRANRLANNLLAGGLRPSSRVGILVPRSIDMYVALLAALKCDATFVPIDHAAPQDRVAYIAEDSGLDLVLTSSRLQGLCEGLDATVLHLDTMSDSLEASPSHRPELETGDDPICYIIYTSGSSGRPKGVEVAQSSICNFIGIVPEIYGVQPADRIYQGMTISFDFSIEEIWPTWAVGATLVAGPTDGRRLGAGLAEFLETSRITMIYCVPTVLSTLERTIPSITTVNVGGEACPPELVEIWGLGRRILNTYGPTEATVTCIWAELQPGRPVTIGKPLPTYTAELLNENLLPVPDGEVGEICIGGPGVARGYVNRPDLTAERFIPDLSSTNGARRYLTGDLGRYLPDGDIEYLGRADAEVKVRGHRVDLQEIESVLLEDDRVAAAVVTLVTTPGSGGELAGYLMLKDAASANGELTTDLHRRAREKLPTYMVPTYLEAITAIPMMPSGKVDRKRLPDPRNPRLVTDSGDHVVAETPTEHQMARIWEETLGLAERSISVSANFFDALGGHSLLAASVVSRLRSEQVAPGVSLLDLYEHPTVRELSQHQDELAARSPGLHADESAAQRPGRPPGWRVAAFGLTQLGWIYSLLVMFLLPVGLVYSLNGGEPSWTTMWQLVLALPVSYVFGRWVLPLVGVRALAGGIGPGTYPLWGHVHLRVWAAQKVMTLSPLSMLAGSPWAENYLRLAGARVGEGCHIGTAEISLPTLVILDDGATVGSATHLRTSEIADGVLTLGTVRVGRDAVVSGNCVLQGPCRVGDGAVLYEQSLLQPGDEVPPQERWVGAPAQPRDDAGDHIFELMADCPLAPRTWPRNLFPWFAAGVVFLEVLPLLALVPIVALVWWTLLAQGELAALAVTAASGPIFVLSTCGLIIAARRLVLPATPVGIHHLRSSIGMQKWFGDKLLELSLMLNNTLYSTLYTPIWLRALGADVGRGAEVSTIANIDPDLLILEDDSFVADMASVGSATYGNGHVAFRLTDVGHRAFVGNAAFIPAGTYVSEDSLVGVLTTPPAAGVEAGSSWLGSPPFNLPTRERYDGFSEAQTFQPSRKQVVSRYVIEFFRIVLPSSILGLSTFATLFALSFVAAAAPLGLVLLATPALALLASLSVVLLVAALKWVLVGRYRSRVEPLWSGFVRRTEFVTGIYEAAAVPVLLAALTGTPILGPLLRVFGAKIGRRTLIDTTYLTEFDLVRVGDDVAIGTAASLQTHLFEDRIMKMSTISLEARSSVGTRAIVLYETVIGENASVAPLSLVMKGEHLLPQSHWHGIPVRHAQRRPHPEPDHTVDTVLDLACLEVDADGAIMAAEAQSSQDLDVAATNDAADIAHACAPASANGTAASTSEVENLGREKPRLAGVDVARAIALIGMIATHVMSEGSPSEGMSLAWTLSSGKSAALFAVLAGVGLAFSSKGVDRFGPRWRATATALVVRSVMIGIIGLLLGSVVPSSTAGVILAFYAVLFVLAIPLLTLSVRTLVAMTGVIAVTVPVLSHLLRGFMAAPVLGNPSFSDLASPGPLLAELTLTGYYPALPWLAYMCAGLAIGRSPLAGRLFVLGMTAAGVVLAAASSGVSWFLLNGLGGRERLADVALQNMPREQVTDLLIWGPEGILPTSSPWWLAVDSPHSTTPVDLLHTIGVAMAVIGFAIILGWITRSAVRPLAAAGSMPLTLYAAHLLLLISPLTVEDGEITSLAFHSFVLVTFAVWWSQRFDRGPLEYVIWRVTGRTRDRVLRRSGAR
jgi:non-ribosomal peptide synthetase-like protein